jgi:hypothetical protein
MGQTKKVKLSILVIELGIIMLVNKTLFWNEVLTILVQEFGIVYNPA